MNRREAIPMTGSTTAVLLAGSLETRIYDKVKTHADIMVVSLAAYAHALITTQTHEFDHFQAFSSFSLMYSSPVPSSQRSLPIEGCSLGFALAPCPIRALYSAHLRSICSKVVRRCMLHTESVFSSVVFSVYADNQTDSRLRRGSVSELISISL